MIDKRLTKLITDSKKYVYITVLLNWIALLVNILFIFSLSATIYNMTQGNEKNVLLFAIATVINLIVRYVCSRAIAITAHNASYQVKLELRDKIFSKLTRLGVSYRDKFSTSELLQISMDGVEQLEVYFANYLPQLIYSMLAPFTLFLALVWVNWKVALFLLICAPLIPFSIAMVQKFAKRLLSKYWSSYANLGDHFLENITGLSTLKIYDADGRKSEEMDADAEHFRVITMKVLSMQLNSIIIMDVIAFGGAAIAMAIAITASPSLYYGVGLIAIILLAADFFIPLRSLGSLFHVAMNGIAAGGKIFKFLSLDEPEIKTKQVEGFDYELKNMKFSYTEDVEVLKNVDILIKEKSFVSISGKSGCGKSTIAKILAGRTHGYKGSVKLGGDELSELSEKSLLENVTVVGNNDFMFAGTIRDNLLFGNPKATDEEMIEALRKVDLSEFIVGESPLSQELTQNANNISGGQKQRLVLARAILKNSPIYIFDEATSNIDAESENKIMEVIYTMKSKHTIILISHRLYNLIPSDMIYLLEDGIVQEYGTHAELIEKNQKYANMYNEQLQLESFGLGVSNNA